MSRSYSDPSYGSKKVVSLPVTDALTGTFSSASTLNSVYKFPYPATVTGCEAAIEILGTGTASEVQIGSELEGTGAWTVFGTATTVGTSTVGEFVSFSVTETDVDTDDTVSVRVYGTDNALATTLIPNVEYRERYRQDDN